MARSLSGIVPARSSDRCEGTITLRQCTATFNIFQFDTPLDCRYLDVISSTDRLQSGDSEYTVNCREIRVRGSSSPATAREQMIAHPAGSDTSIINDQDSTQDLIQPGFQSSLCHILSGVLGFKVASAIILALGSTVRAQHTRCQGVPSFANYCSVISR